MAVISNATTPASGAPTQPLVRVDGDVYDLVISNNAGVVVYLGVSAGVSSTNGCPLANGQSIKLTGIGGGAAAAFYVTIASGAASGVVGYVLTTPR